MFKKYGKKLNLCYNNEDAVTYGAALYSAKLKGAEGIRLIDCMPFSLGVEI
jgi:molecular chaperone DnaK (HSP70)